MDELKPVLQPEETNDICLKTHPFCNTCAKFNPVIRERPVITCVCYEDFRLNEHKEVLRPTGRYVVSCENYDICESIKQYIMNSPKEEGQKL